MFERDGFKVEKYFALDTETTGLSTFHGERPFAVSIMSDEGDVWYCEWMVDPWTRGVTPNEDDLEFIQWLCGIPELEMAAFNLKFDKRMLSCFGIELKCKTHEVNFMARIYNTQELPAKLKPLAWKYAQIPTDDEKLLHDDVVRARRIGKQRGYLLGEDVAQDMWLPKHLDPENNYCQIYALQDAFRTLALFYFYKQMFDKDAADPYLDDAGAFWKVYNEIEMPLEPIIYEIEGRGVRIDKDKNCILHAEHVMMADEGLIKLREMIGNQNFTTNSSKQVCNYLYTPKHLGGLGLKCEVFTDSGEYSANAKALRFHINEPFVALLSQTKAAEKAVSTFFEKYDFLAVDDPLCPGQHCLHTSYMQVDTRTSRLSSRNPNLQQVADPSVSTRSPIPIFARTPFGPRPGYIWYTIDYSQQEIRIFADLAKAQAMIDACMGGRDINTENANRAWGGEGNRFALEAAANSLALGLTDLHDEAVLKVWKEYDWSYDKARLGMTSPEALRVAEDYLRRYNYDIVAMEASIGKKAVRNRAKMVFFAKIYGGGPSAVTSLLYCTLSEAKSFMDVFDRMFPEIANYTQKLTREARMSGYIVNPYGRRIHIDMSHAYKCVNYMIQSTAADMMKDSLIKTYGVLKRSGLDAHIVMTVHDEIVFEIKKGHDHQWLLRELCATMQDNGGRLTVPMEVEMQRADEQWNQKIKVDLGD